MGWREFITHSKSSVCLQVRIIPEGAACLDALPGLVRMVHALAGGGTPEGGHWTVVVDSGTGTSAIGAAVLAFTSTSPLEMLSLMLLIVSMHTGMRLQQPVPAAGMALGVALCGLQWRIRGVMLAGNRTYYEDQAANLALAFQQQYGGSVTAEDLPLEWVERPLPRRFGKVLAGEVAACARIARQHGILLDPIYSLAAWEVAEQLACREGKRNIALLHAGGSLALHGLAQRFPDQF